MKQLSSLPPCRKLAALGGRLCRYELAHDGELTLSLYADRGAQTPVCTHRLKSHSRHNLFCVLGLLGGVILLISLIGLGRRLLCNLYKH